MSETKTDHQKAINQAAAWLERRPVFLDTETNGLDEEAGICDIAAIDHNGDILLDTLIRPRLPIPADLTAIHGITNEMVRGAPDMSQIQEELDKLLRGRAVIIYNLDFDTRMLIQSLAPALGASSSFQWWWQARPDETQAEFHARPDRWHCAMKLYAAYYGEWNSYRRSYRWQALAAAARQCGLTVPAGIHRAKADAELTRQIVLCMANQKQNEAQS